MSGGTVSHCAVCLGVYGEPMVVSSSLLGVEMVTRTRWLADHRVVAELEVPGGDEPHPHLFLAQLGAGYDYSGMLGYLPIFVARWLRRRVRNPWASPTRSVCTELIVRAMQARYRPNGWGMLDPEATYPSELLALCRRLQYFEMPRVSSSDD